MAQAVPATRTIKLRSPWGVWWLSLITLGIYYLVWHVKINKDIASLSGGRIKVGTFGLWASQCVPIVGWISIHASAGRLSQVQAPHGWAPTASGGISILANIWFWSNTRYLQRRVNSFVRAIEKESAQVPTSAEPIVP